MKPRKYVYIGERVPDLNAPEYMEFLLHLQESVLYALEKRNLLTHSQAEQCMAEIEKRNTKDCSRHRA